MLGLIFLIVIVLESGVLWVEGCVDWCGCLCCLMMLVFLVFIVILVLFGFVIGCMIVVQQIVCVEVMVEGDVLLVLFGLMGDLCDVEIGQCGFLLIVDWMYFNFYFDVWWMFDFMFVVVCCEVGDVCDDLQDGEWFNCIEMVVCVKFVEMDCMIVLSCVGLQDEVMVFVWFDIGKQQMDVVCVDIVVMSVECV